MRTRFATAFATILLVIACEQHDASATKDNITSKVSSMTQRISIRVGEMGPAFARRYPGSVRVEHQPAGIDFYSINWERPRGVVTVDHGNNSFEIEDMLSVLASQDLGSLKDEGLAELHINAGMSVPSPSLISHDEARLRTYAILRAILDAGWKSIIPRSDPRISGRLRFTHAMSVDDTIGLDPLYVPPFEEWMNIPSRTAWMFYANGLYMDVSFTREPTLLDPTKPGSYLLTFDIKTETEYFRGFAGPDNRLRWKEVVPAELIKIAAERAKKETELRAKAIVIDEAYKDPPVPSFK